MRPLCCCETGTTEAFCNLAMEEALTEAVTRQPPDGRTGFFLLWQNRSAVIIGKHQHAAGEVNLAQLRQRGIVLARRLTGGGAVYQDLGNLNYSFILPAARMVKPDIGELLEPMIAYFRSLGLEAGLEGRNDLTLRGLGKFSGLAVRRAPDVFHLHGTLLFDVDLAVLEQVLLVDPEKYRSKGVQSVRARVTNLRPFVTLSLPELWTGLRRAYATEVSPVPAGAAARARQLVEEKYSRPEWNIGLNPPADLVLKKRFAFGGLALHLGTRGNVIREARLTGDFLAASALARPLEVEALERLLQGLPADDPAAWANAWRSVDMNRVFHGGADSEEISAWLETALEG